MENRRPSGAIAATSAAFARMKHILFHPFDAGKWFVLGFTAFLASLFDGSGGGNGGGGDYGDSFGTSGEGEESPGPISGEEVKETVAGWIRTAKQWIADNPEIVTGIAVALLFVLAIVFVLFWVRCRGKFMFLDNVVQNRALVAHPWRTYRRQGNSLFWWSTIYGFIALGLFLGTAVGIGFYVYSVLGDGGSWNMTATLITILMGGTFFVLWILLAYISMALEDFVTPLMYRDYLTTTEAWGKFLQLQNRNLFRFFGYAIWKFVLSLGIGLGLLIVGIATCCIGLILMAIPYIGAVFLLPVSVFVRSIGPEYLAQFGEEYDVFHLEQR